MRLQAQTGRHLTYSVIAVLLLIGCITSICLYYLARQQTNNEYYHNTSPALYISDARSAHIWTITDTLHLPLDTLYPTTHIPLLPLHREHNAKYLIAIYPDSAWAVWLAIHPDKTKSAIAYFSNNISNDFTPIEEEKGNGSIYHFATHDHRFFHLYTQPGIIGYSYSERLLTDPDNDKSLQQIIDELQTFSHNRLLIFNKGQWQSSQGPYAAQPDSTQNPNKP